MVRTLTSKWLTFKAQGHSNVRATHRTTLEITKESYLTPRGDCIIGVSSEYGVADLPEWFKKAAQKEDSIIVMIICSDNICDSVIGRGHPKLSFDDPLRIVVRRSSYIDSKTIMIRANKSARDLRRDLIRKLHSGEELIVYLTVLNTP